MARLAIGNWQRERTKRECQSFVIVAGRARLQTSHRKDPGQNVCHRFEGGKGEAERLHARGTCLAATTRADTEDAQRFATDRAYTHDDMNFGRTCKRFLALGRPRRARFAASPTAHLPHPRFLAAREDEQKRRWFGAWRVARRPVRWRCVPQPPHAEEPLPHDGVEG